MPRLSLIVATYNRAEQLLTTLWSVAAQTAPAAEWECVVVDNNSTDDTAARFEEFLSAHPGLPLRRVSETRQGLSWARNRGIAETTGDIVAIIDDDERIVPEFIAAYIAFFDAHPSVASAGGPIVAEYPAGRPAWMSRYTERPIANPIDLGPTPRPFPRGRIPGGGNMALRRTALGRYGAFDPQLGRRGARLLGGEESDLFARLRRGGEQCWYVPGAVMYHIIPPSKPHTRLFRPSVPQYRREPAHAGRDRRRSAAPVDGRGGQVVRHAGDRPRLLPDGPRAACGVARADAAADYGGVADLGRVGRRMRDLRVS